MLGLVFQALLGAFMLPMSSAATSSAASTAWNNAICVTMGIKQAADGGSQTEPGSGGPAGEACNVCAVLALSGLALVPVFQPLPLDLPAPSAAQPGADQRPPRAAILARHSRGPPAFRNNASVPRPLESFRPARCPASGMLRLENRCGPKLQLPVPPIQRHLPDFREFFSDTGRPARGTHPSATRPPAAPRLLAPAWHFHRFAKVKDMTICLRCDTCPVREQGICSTLGREQLLAFSAIARGKFVEAGQAIFRQGDETQFYAIVFPARSS
jgi:hypothetical protein